MSIQSRTDGYIYKSELDINEVQVMFTMTKGSVMDYNQPYVWSLQAFPLAQWNNLNETPLNHNFQPNMADSYIVAVGLGNSYNNKFILDSCKVMLPPGTVLGFVIEPEDKTNEATYYTEINVVYDNYW
ncbi:hypothetical protein PIROE2DRAFT_1207 [Piromyces sp. E2]|nr:hypothetical protein PIROE2DRAFT_1207 [Piromyces sp. E2]|eukprot:OUM70667.1 hypothetical protein PIROE2DRAFT_1207 [Piromyces sp. E2]